MFARALVSPSRAALLEQRARAMRLSPTRSEEWLWRRLSASRTGFPFRRQLVIGPFIVDFASTMVRLVVEVDGGCHERRLRKNTRRDAALLTLGWSFSASRNAWSLTTSITSWNAFGQRPPPACTSAVANRGAGSARARGARSRVAPSPVAVHLGGRRLSMASSLLLVTAPSLQDGKGTVLAAVGTLRVCGRTFAHCDHQDPPLLST